MPKHCSTLSTLNNVLVYSEIHLDVLFTSGTLRSVRRMLRPLPSKSSHAWLQTLVYFPSAQTIRVKGLRNRLIFHLFDHWPLLSQLKGDRNHTRNCHVRTWLYMHVRVHINAGIHVTVLCPREDLYTGPLGFCAALHRCHNPQRKLFEVEQGSWGRTIELPTHLSPFLQDERVRVCTVDQYSKARLPARSKWDREANGVKALAKQQERVYTGPGGIAVILQTSTGKGTGNLNRVVMI
jgi:hypothetical protein